MWDAITCVTEQNERWSVYLDVDMSLVFLLGQLASDIDPSFGVTLPNSHHWSLVFKKRSFDNSVVHWTQWYHDVIQSDGHHDPHDPHDQVFLSRPGQPGSEVTFGGQNWRRTQGPMTWARRLRHWYGICRRPGAIFGHSQGACVTEATRLLGSCSLRGTEFHKSKGSSTVFTSNDKPLKR